MRQPCLALTALTLALANAPCQGPASPTASELVKILDDKKASPAARAQAARALGALGARAEVGLPSLVRAIDEYEQDLAERRKKDKKVGSTSLYNVRYEAGLAIGKIALAIPAAPAPRAAKTVADYAKDLSGPEAHARLAALKFFQVLHSSSLPGVVRAVRDSDEDVRSLAGKTVAAARKTLAKAEPSVQALIEELKDTDESARLRAAKKLAMLGKKATPALAALAEAVKDKDEDVARVAKSAVARIKAAKR